MPLELKKLFLLPQYGRAKFLKVISAINLWIALILLFSPLFLPYLFKWISIHAEKIVKPETQKVIDELGFLFGLALLVQAGVNVIREYFLTKVQIVDIEFKKNLIRQIITLLMDVYGWKGTCRATVFIPVEGFKCIKIYDRISAGYGPGGFDAGKCFFIKGQGIPGLAWNTAWSGEDQESLVRAIQVSNIPENLLTDKES